MDMIGLGGVKDFALESHQNVENMKEGVKNFGAKIVDDPFGMAKKGWNAGTKFVTDFGNDLDETANGATGADRFQASVRVGDTVTETVLLVNAASDAAKVAKVGIDLGRKVAADLAFKLKYPNVSVIPAAESAAGIDYAAELVLNPKTGKYEVPEAAGNPGAYGNPMPAAKEPPRLTYEPKPPVVIDAAPPAGSPTPNLPARYNPAATGVVDSAAADAAALAAARRLLPLADAASAGADAATAAGAAARAPKPADPVPADPAPADPVPPSGPRPVAIADAPEYLKKVGAFTGKSDAELADFYKVIEKKGANYEELIGEAVAKHGLTSDEAHAVFGYTTNLFYRDLNKALTKGGNADAEALSQLIASGMEKMPKSATTQYRGWRLEPTELPAFDAEYANGNIVKSNFWSSGPTLDNSYIAPRVVKMYTESARDISDLAFGVHYNDLVGKPKYSSETLVPPNVEFKVLGKDADGKILLKEVKK